MPRSRAFKPSSQWRKAVQKVVSKNLETKTAVFSHSADPIQDNGRTPIDDDLTGLVQGDSQNERVGNQIRLKSITFDGFFTVADTTNSIRMVLYNPYDTDDSLSGSALAFNGNIDLDKFRVLRDIWIPLASGGPANARKRFRVNFKGSGLRIQWSDTTATSQTLNRPRLYIVSDSAAVSDPELSGHVRVKYTDA